MNRNISIFAFYGVLAIYLGWMLWLPFFPSQDGPAYLYYAHVFSRLLSGSEAYQHFFAIKNFLPPELTHFYLAYFLSKFLTPVWADKIIAILCFLSVALGSRFLMKSIKAGEPAIAIFAIPLAMSWPLFMGFYNYVMGVGLAAFAAGLWCRATVHRSLRLWAGFYTLLFLLLATHPLPLIALFCFCGGEWVVRMVRSRDLNLNHYRGESGLLLAALLCGLYIARFLGMQQGAIFPANASTRESVRDIIGGSSVLPVQGAISVPIRVALLMLLVFCIQCALFGAVKRFRTKNLQVSDVLLCFGIILFCAIPFLPFEFNHAAFVAQRLVLTLWLFMLLAAGTNVVPKKEESAAITIAGVVFSLALLAVHASILGPVIKQIQSSPKIEDARGQTGFLIGRMQDSIEPRLSYDPFFYSGLRSFTEGDVVWLNAPWLQAPTSILASRYRNLSELLRENGEVDMHPAFILNSISEGEKIKRDLRTSIGVLLIEGERNRDSGREAKLAAIVEDGDWNCQSTGLYEVCRRSRKE